MTRPRDFSFWPFFIFLFAAIVLAPILRAQESNGPSSVGLLSTSSVHLKSFFSPTQPLPRTPSFNFVSDATPKYAPRDNDSMNQATAVPPQRDVSWKLLPKQFLEDQKDMWFTFPDHLLFHGQHWRPTLSIITVASGLVVADPYDTPYFRRTHQYQDFSNVFSKANTDGLLAIGPSAVYLIGLWRKDSFAQKTAIFSGEAAADAMVFYGVAQGITPRARPIDIAPNGDFRRTFFHGKGIISNSFPSGHAAEAFAIATVFERRYRRHRWVPWLAYGVAGVICFSRITLQSHFPSDVFVGSAIGYTVGRYVALQGQ